MTAAKVAPVIGNLLSIPSPEGLRNEALSEENIESATSGKGQDTAYVWFVYLSVSIGCGSGNSSLSSLISQLLTQLARLHCPNSSCITYLCQF